MGGPLTEQALIPFYSLGALTRPKGPFCKATLGSRAFGVLDVFYGFGVITVSGRGVDPPRVDPPELSEALFKPVDEQLNGIYLGFKELPVYTIQVQGSLGFLGCRT